MKLTATGIKNLSPGMHGDGNGLFSVSSPQSGARGCFATSGKAKRGRWALVPSLPSRSLRREKAQAARKQLANDIDPLDQRKAERQAAEANEAKATTFADAAEACIAAHKAGWGNAKHAAQWRSTIQTYDNPVIGTKACGATADILEVLQPIWTQIPETASRCAAGLK